jgi:formylglycine-generating enzyme required for sulfatase activity
LTIFAYDVYNGAKMSDIKKLAGISALLLLLLAVAAPAASANNLSITNVKLVDRDTAGGTYNIRFDISWDNSWFIEGAPGPSANWDAAWVFAKYSTYAGGGWEEWKHCKLLNTGYSAPAGSQMAFGETGGDYPGVFMYRNAAGTGSVNWTGAELRWDYGADLVADTTIVKVKVFGVEMVYIPEGSFYAGSGGTETSAFYRYPVTAEAYAVTSEAAISVGEQNGSLYYNSSPHGGDRLGPIPAAFPKGYNAFYLMKYSITQGQYADFLNNLTFMQASARYPNFSGTNRYTISGSHPNYSAARPDRLCNYLSWMDVAAYAAWAALRPFTELEYEKACRGALVSPVANEYAWGSTAITAAAAISGAEDGTETITTAGANCTYSSLTFTGGDGGTGPLRAGIFARPGNSRAQSGAAFYGSLDMSGNVWERPVTVGNPEGRAFTGTHGRGELSAGGFAVNADWPGFSSGEVTGAAGVGSRGGSWYLSASVARVSDRNLAAFTLAPRSDNYGGRLARTSP